MKKLISLGIALALLGSFALPAYAVFDLSDLIDQMDTIVVNYNEAQVETAAVATSNTGDNLQVNRAVDGGDVQNNGGDIMTTGSASATATAIADVNQNQISVLTANYEDTLVANINLASVGTAAAADADSGWNIQRDVALDGDVEYNGGDNMTTCIATSVSGAQAQVNIDVINISTVEPLAE